MSRIFGTLFFLILLMAPRAALADFYVIAGGGPPVGTEIKSLPYTLSSPGFYFIKKDLTCGDGSHGITITADDVTLDLMGFSLIGPGGTGSYAGIHMSGRLNVEIRNGTVRGFNGHGIWEENGHGHRVINVRVRENGSSGIYLSSESNLVSGCTAMKNGGNGIFSGFRSTVKDSVCYDNPWNGLMAGNGSTVTGNTCYHNGGRGIQASSGSTVTGNTCFYNETGGILAYDGSTVTGNSCNFNHDNYGIATGGECLVMGNTAMNNAPANIKNTASCTYVNNHGGP